MTLCPVESMTDPLIPSPEPAGWGRIRGKGAYGKGLGSVFGTDPQGIAGQVPESMFSAENPAQWMGSAPPRGSGHEGHRTSAAFRLAHVWIGKRRQHHAGTIAKAQREPVALALAAQGQPVMVV